MKLLAGSGRTASALETTDTQDPPRSAERATSYGKIHRAAIYMLDIPYCRTAAFFGRIEGSALDGFPLERGRKRKGSSGLGPGLPR